MGVSVSSWCIVSAVPSSSCSSGIGSMSWDTVLPWSCSNVIFPWSHSLLWVPHLPTSRYLLHHGPPGNAGAHHGLQGILCSGAWSTSSLTFFIYSQLLLSHILTVLSQALFPSSFCPFWNTLSQNHYHHHKQAWSPVACLPWSQVTLVPSDTGELSDIFSEKPPLQFTLPPKLCNGNPMHMDSPPSHSLYGRCSLPLTDHWFFLSISFSATWSFWEERIWTIQCSRYGWTTDLANLHFVLL